MVIFGCQFRLETTSEIARNYCLTKQDMFILPSRDDFVEHRVVVTTLSTTQVLLDLQLLRGFFNILLQFLTCVPFKFTLQGKKSLKGFQYKFDFHVWCIRKMFNMLRLRT